MRLLNHSTGTFLVTLPYAASQIVSTGLTIYFNHIPYYLSPHTIGKISLASNFSSPIQGTFGLVPVTIFRDNVQPLDLPTIVEDWLIRDDVFQEGFLQVALIQCNSGNLSLPLEHNVTANYTSILHGYTSTSKIPNGPYFLEEKTGNLHPVHRLYDDIAGAFTEALLANPDGTFQTLSAKIPSSATLTVGVPSRLYHEPSKEFPLAGVRIAVKDIFSLAGVKKSNGNRAWYQLYPPSNITGTAISRLINAGAIIVGTQKLSQFATSEVATVDWVDYHSPFNPRGDGYQDPSSSSSGAGASIATYDWLDAAIGTDTGGSIRSPAGVNGIFGNRPSHNVVSLDYVMPLSEPLDTVGFLVRDPILWETLQAVMYSEKYVSLVNTERRYPTRIWTVDFPNSSTEAGRYLNDFSAALAEYVGGSVDVLNLTEHWSTSENNPYASVNMTRMLNTTYPVLTGQGQEADVVQPFYADYAAWHDGRRPFVNPGPLARWEWAANYSWDEAIHNKTVFKDWFNGEILPPVDDASQCSSGFILYPGKTGTQTLRNKYDISRPKPFFGFSAARISVFSECPDFIYPIGEVSSYSNITAHVEHLPVAVGILAAKGCDGLLAKLAIDLVENGILQVPQVGSSMYGT
jgi:hypothetical protein